MKACIEGAKDVAAIELTCGEEVEGGSEKTDPGGAADGVEQEGIRGRAWTKDGSEKT